MAVEQEKGADISFDDVMEDVAGVYTRVMFDGEMDVGDWSCVMVAGLINKNPLVKN